MRREAEDEDPLDPGIFDRSTGDQEELIDILRSIMFDGRRISSVNVPNTGYCRTSRRVLYWRYLGWQPRADCAR